MISHHTVQALPAELQQVILATSAHGSLGICAGWGKARLKYGDGARWRYLSEQHNHQGQQAQHEGCQRKVPPQHREIPSALQRHPCLLERLLRCALFEASTHVCNWCRDIVMSRQSSRHMAVRICHGLQMEHPE